MSVDLYILSSFEFKYIKMKDMSSKEQIYNDKKI